MRLFLLVLSAVFATNVSAATATGRTTKSTKKIVADETDMAPAQVVEKNDNIVGFRVSQGDVFDSKPLIGGNFEHMLSPNFGIGGQMHYAQYSKIYNFGPYRGTWDYQALAVIGFGTFHFDIFKVKNLDTFISAGFGHTFISSSWSTNVPYSSGEYGTADGSSSYLLAYANIRYFINSHWGFSGALGAPLGTLALGADYLF